MKKTMLCSKPITQQPCLHTAINRSYFSISFYIYKNVEIGVHVYKLYR